MQDDSEEAENARLTAELQAIPWQVEYLGQGVCKETGWEHHKWEIFLSRGNEAMAIDYHTGLGCRDAVGNPKHPVKLDIFEYMFRAYYACQDEFENWAADCGLDVDSIKSRDIYMGCRRQAEDLERLFTTDEISNLDTLFRDF